MPRVAVLLALLVACGPAHRLVREGREATVTEQWAVAYRAYDSALRYKPGQPEALAGRARARDVLLGALDASLEQALAQGRLHDLPPLVDEARRYDPDPAWVQRWQQAWRTAWIERLEADHTQARQAGLVGDAWVYASALAELDASPAREQALDRAWRQMREQEWPAVGIVGQDRTARELAGDVAVRWRETGWASVPVRHSRSELGLVMDVRELDCDTERIGTRTQVQRYRDGTMVRNPRIPELHAMLDDALAQLDSAQRSLEARRTQEQQAGARASAAQRDLERALPDLDAAQREVVAAAERRDAMRAAVTESEEAVDIVHHLRGQQQQLRGERHALLDERRGLDAEHGHLAGRLQEAQARVDDARSSLRQARSQAAKAKQAAQEAQADRDRIQERREAVRAELEELGAEPLPPDDKLAPLPRLEDLLEAAETALNDATAQNKALQRARDRAAQAAAAGGAAEAAALEEAEAALAAHQPKVVEAADAQRDARIALLQARHRRLSRRLARAEQALADAQQAHTEARSAARALEPALDQANQARADIEEDLAQVDAHLARIEQRLDRIEHRLPRIQSRLEGLAPIAADLQRREQLFRRALRDWRDLEARLDAVGQATAQLTARRDRTASELLDARELRLEAASAVEGWLDRRQSLRQELDAQPARVELDKQAEYTVSRYRRTCTARVDWSVHAPLAGVGSSQLELTRVDEDDTWRANPRIRLQADPLAFPASQEQVLLGLRAQASAELFSVLSAHVQAEGQARRQRSADTPDAGTRLLAIARLMDGQDEALTTHLQSAYDLPQQAP